MESIPSIKFKIIVQKKGESMIESTLKEYLVEGKIKECKVDFVEIESHG